VDNFIKSNITAANAAIEVTRKFFPTNITAANAAIGSIGQIFSKNITAVNVANATCRNLVYVSSVNNLLVKVGLNSMFDI